MEEHRTDMKVFPNPCVNCNSLSVNAQMEKVKQITISDMFGKVITQELFVSYTPGSAMRLDFPQTLEKGMYNITVQTETEMSTEKLVVE
ncbi:MAG: T9SS type A sorting domain-containing protein [Flavobacteriales bacterium]